MEIRPMCAGDIPAVVAIEARSLSPWNEQQIAAELARTDSTCLVAADPSGSVSAWCCGRHIGEEAELLKIGVVPAHRRQGLAESLLNQLLLHWKRIGVEQIFLEVRSHNHAARQLYRKLGWHEDGWRKGYYRNPVDDAIIYRHSL